MPQERTSPSPSTASSTKNQKYDYKVYHATTKGNAESIIKEDRFRLPTQKDAIERGLKLGAAVYFGFDPNYCLQEAFNTLLETEPRLLRQDNFIGLLSNDDKIQIQNERLVCLEVDIELINGPLSIFSFGNYHDGQSGSNIGHYWIIIHLKVQQHPNNYYYRMVMTHLNQQVGYHLKNGMKQLND